MALTALNFPDIAIILFHVKLADSFDAEFALLCAGVSRERTGWRRADFGFHVKPGK